MKDKSATISELKEVMEKFVGERNWKSYHHPKELAIALSIESNELLELFLFSNMSLIEIRQNPLLLENISEEIADVFAYTLSLVNTLELDLSTIFLNKMDKNQKKYPSIEFSGNYTKQ